jgi:SOS-response transcriptional repressor LexA
VVENGQSHSVKVYPNPASDVFVLDMTLASTEQVNVELVNSIGQVVFSQNEGSVSGSRKMNIDLNNQADGLYFVRVTIGGETRTMKLNIAK